jgi:hypothetical protein
MKKVRKNVTGERSTKLENHKVIAKKAEGYSENKWNKRRGQCNRQSLVKQGNAIKESF